MDTVKTFLVDWSRLNREGFRRLLANTGFELVGDAADLKGLAHAREQGLQVDCLLVDIDRGDTDAYEFLSEARKVVAQDSRIVALTSQGSPTLLYKVFAAGADGLLHQDISCAALMESLRLVMLGERVFPSALTTELLNGLNAGDLSFNGSVANGGSRLTQRETEVLKALATGQSNKMIANQLDINEATVKAHLKSIQRKLNVTNRTQAAIWALDHGLCGRPVSKHGPAPSHKSTLAGGQTSGGTS